MSDPEQQEEEKEEEQIVVESPPAAEEPQTHDEPEPAELPAPLSLFWSGFWKALDESKKSDIQDESVALTPADHNLNLLATLRRLVPTQLNAAAPQVSLFSIVWAAHSLVSADIDAALIMSGLPQEERAFGFQHELACLTILEAACDAETACLPVPLTVEDDNAGKNESDTKARSPFFPLLVQSTLTALQRATPQPQEQVVVLDFIEQAVLPSMLGLEKHRELLDAVQSAFIPEELRKFVDEAVREWTTVYAAESKTHVDPFLMFATAFRDKDKKKTFLKQLSAATTASDDVGRLTPGDLLQPQRSSLDPPFARPLPPPAFPLYGYEEDDFEALTPEEESELLEYLHAELIWCTPACHRLLLLPDDADEDIVANERFRNVLDLLQTKAFDKPLAPTERRQVMELLGSDTSKSDGNSSSEDPPATNQEDLAHRLVRDCGLTPQNLPRLVEHNPLVAHECLLRILQSAPEDEKNEYLSSLVGMDMSLHSLDVVYRLAAHNANAIASTASSMDGKRGSKQSQPQKASTPILHPEYIHLFIGSCIASCENIQDRHAQNRLVRLVCVFIQSLLRNNIVETEDIYFAAQSFCVAFSRIREASALFKSLQQHGG